MKRTPRKATKAVYPFLAFRPSPLVERRLRALSGVSGQPISKLIAECVAAHLHVIEAAQKEAA